MRKTASAMVLSFFVLLSAVLFAMYSSGVRGVATFDARVRFCLQRLAGDEFPQNRGRWDGCDFSRGEFDDVAQELQDACCLCVCR